MLNPKLKNSNNVSKIHLYLNILLILILLIILIDSIHYNTIFHNKMYSSKSVDYDLLEQIDAEDTGSKIDITTTHETESPPAPIENNNIVEQTTTDNNEIIVNTNKITEDQIKENIEGKTYDEAMLATCNSFDLEKVDIENYLFCSSFPLVYRRGYTNEISNKMGLYEGNDTPPFQMGMIQYQYIAYTIGSFPRYNVYTKKFEKLQPRILFMGMGADTEMWLHFMKLLRVGELEFVETHQGWIDKLKKNLGSKLKSEQIIFADWGKTHVTQFDKILSTVSNPEGEFLAGCEDESCAERKYKDLEKDVKFVPDHVFTTNNKAYDYIIVDGPSGFTGPGRGPALYAAARLAAFAPKNHYTHIWLHDAARHSEKTMSMNLMGLNPRHYLADTLKRKGLRLWRVEGKGWSLPSYM